MISKDPRTEEKLVVVKNNRLNFSHIRLIARSDCAVFNKELIRHLPKPGYEGFHRTVGADVLVEDFLAQSEAFSEKELAIEEAAAKKSALLNPTLKPAMSRSEMFLQSSKAQGPVTKAASADDVQRSKTLDVKRKSAAQTC